MNTSKTFGAQVPSLGFRIIFFLYLISWIVPVFKTLPVTPHESLYVYFWFGFGLIVFPWIFMTRDFLITAFFLFLHLLYIASDNYSAFHVRHKTLFDVFLMYSYPITLFVYFFRSIPLGNIRFFAPVILIFLTFTSITTIFAISKFPEASRALAGNDNQEEVMLYLGMNVGSYDFIYLHTLVAPMFLYFYKKKMQIKWLLLFALSAWVILAAQFTAAIILFMVSVLFTLLIVFQLSLKKYLVAVLIFFLGFFLFKPVLVEFLVVFSDYIVAFETVHGKINEVIMSLEGKKLGGTSLEAYSMRYDISLNAFLASPIFGGNSGGGHHYWLDILALYGITGFVVFIFIFKRFIKTVVRHPFFSQIEKNLLIHTTLMFIAIGLNKNIILSMPVILFVVCPLLMLRYGDYLERFGVPINNDALAKASIAFSLPRNDA